MDDEPTVQPKVIDIDQSASKDTKQVENVEQPAAVKEMSQELKEEEEIVITNLPAARQPITHDDMNTTPVPVFDCAFCLRDQQAQMQALYDVGEKTLWNSWANKRRIDICLNQ